jgi:hypothetical protein
VEEPHKEGTPGRQYSQATIGRLVRSLGKRTQCGCRCLSWVEFVQWWKCDQHSCRAWEKASRKLEAQIGSCYRPRWERSTPFGRLSDISTNIPAGFLSHMALQPTLNLCLLFSFHLRPWHLERRQKARKKYTPRTGQMGLASLCHLLAPCVERRNNHTLRVSPRAESFTVLICGLLEMISLMI